MYFGLWKEAEPGKHEQVENLSSTHDSKMIYEQPKFWEPAVRPAWNTAETVIIKLQKVSKYRQFIRKIKTAYKLDRDENIYYFLVNT